MNANISDSKRANGQYYTEGNPFVFIAFQEWSKDCELSKQRILEPFAGKKDIPKLVEYAISKDDCEWGLYDINPLSNDVINQDTLLSFPKGFDVSITNPPWLARNSATRRDLPFPKLCLYDDLYKYAVEQCLTNCKWVAAVVPESFIRSGLFMDRLIHFISIIPTNNSTECVRLNKHHMFSDTEHPVGLALFGPEKTNDVLIWRNNEFLGSFNTLRNFLPKKSSYKSIVFNHPEGNLGLIGIDNTLTSSIRFCLQEELVDYDVSNKCRSITKILVPDDLTVDIGKLNNRLNDIRKNTYDVFLTAFKGLRKDGYYRRRLDFSLARSIIDYDNIQISLL